jgi:putative ABC transport system permease protein
MLKNYLLIALRNVKKHFSYSLINIAGLGLGLATCLLLVVWITHEISYDRFHAHAGRIQRVSLEYSFGGQVSKTAVSPNALLPALLSLPGAETGVRIYSWGTRAPFIIRNGDKVFQETGFCFADSTFFKVFSFPVVKGNPDKILTHPYSIALTQTAARKYFGDADPIGKVLHVDNKQDYVVTGILEDVPSNSSLQFDFLASFSSLPASHEKPTWWSANYHTFIVTRPDADLAAMKEKIDAIGMKAVSADLTGEGDYVQYNFLPLTDLHLRSDYHGELAMTGDIQYIYIFTAIAILILAIACINYINLATARAADRAREVGIRKVVGALRKQLFFQFIGESCIITFLAFCLAYFMAQVSLPFFNELAGTTFGYDHLLRPSFVALSLVGLITIALLSGAYPAFAIAAFKPASVLKGNFKTSAKGIWLRKALVVFQFSISVILIVGTMVVLRQLEFIQNKKLGYDRSNTIMLSLDKETSQVFESFRSELLRNGLAEHVGRGSEPPTQVLAGYSIRRVGETTPGIIITGLIVDDQYVPAVNMEIIEGRNFTRDELARLEKDSAYAFILNESALEQLYMSKEEAVGKKMTMGDRTGEIVGIVKDFHFSSLHDPINPLVMFPEKHNLQKILIRLKPGDVPASLKQIERTYASLITHRPFEYEFMDDQYNALYIGEQRMGRIFIVFAVLAIVIACLGLLGLVSFSAAQKTKEIGVRKVFGATASSIVLLITRDFTRLIVIAMLLGLPLAYWIMDQWLNDFAYKTAIGVWPLVLAPVLCLLIALGTASFQAVKAAMLDPARTLRND